MRQDQRALLSIEDAREPFFVGVDIGGTSMKVGLVDDFGRSVCTGEVDADGVSRRFIAIKTDMNPHNAVKLLTESINVLCNRLGLTKSQCCAIGLGVPGTLNPKTQCLRELPNLHGWNGFPIAVEVEKSAGIPVTFCNDANAAAYGEFWVGSAAGKKSVALLTLGTGIGCGIIIDGRSINGETGYGGECGHIIIDSSANAMICGCGVRGHLEAYSGSLGVARRTLELTTRRPSSIRNKITPETRMSDIARIVYVEAENGDEAAIEIVLETAKYLAIGITSILHTIDPDCILLGGAMTFGGNESEIGRRFLQKIIDEVKRQTFIAVAENLSIEFSTLGSDAGFIGAAGLARKNFLDQKTI
ncbi:MAG: ROK family protein [Planctomycetaceae bacterium]|jgi:glucokinase|nr:ROK family protein [Planctomycetaceae bacterium]